MVYHTQKMSTIFQFMLYWTCLEPVTSCRYHNMVEWRHHFCSDIISHVTIVRCSELIIYIVIIKTHHYMPLDKLAVPRTCSEFEWVHLWFKIVVNSTREFYTTNREFPPNWYSKWRTPCIVCTISEPTLLHVLLFLMHPFHTNTLFNIKIFKPTLSPNTHFLKRALHIMFDIRLKCVIHVGCVGQWGGMLSGVQVAISRESGTKNPFLKSILIDVCLAVRLFCVITIGLQ